MPTPTEQAFDQIREARDALHKEYRASMSDDSAEAEMWRVHIKLQLEMMTYQLRSLQRKIWAHILSK